MVALILFWKMAEMWRMHEDRKWLVLISLWKCTYTCVNFFFQFKEPMIVLLLASGVVSIIMGQFDDAFSITVVSNRGNSLIKLDLVSLTRNLAVCSQFYNSFFLSTIFIHFFIFILKFATLYKYSDIHEYPMHLAWFV